MRFCAAASILLLLTGCHIAVPVVAAGLGLGAAALTFDGRVLDDCIAGKPQFNCKTPAPK